MSPQAAKKPTSSKSSSTKSTASKSTASKTGTSTAQAKAAREAQAAASSTIDKAAQTAFSAAESTQQAAANVVNIGTSAMRDMLTTGTGEAARAQEKAFEIGREGVENFARSCDMFTRMLTEMASIYRDNMEAVIECCNISANVAREITEEVSESCNRAFSESIEICTDAFSCRTINDVVELQNRAVRQCIDNCFEETNRLCNIAYECCNEAIEPINERVAEASQQFSRVISA